MALTCVFNLKSAISSHRMYFSSSLSVKQASSQRGSFTLELSSSETAHAMCDCALRWTGAGTSSRGDFILHL